MNQTTNPQTGEVATIPDDASPLERSLATYEVSDAEYLEASEQSIQESGGDYYGFGFLNFKGQGEIGEFSVGSGTDRTVLDLSETLFAAPHRLIMDGFIYWDDRSAEPVDKVAWPMVLGKTNAVPYANLPDHSGGQTLSPQEGWKRMKGMTLIYSGASLEVNADRRPLLYTTTATSAIMVINALIGQINQRIRTGQPCVPIFVMGHTTFKSKNKINSKPVFTIVGWLTDEELILVDKGELDLNEHVIAASQGVQPQPQAKAPAPAPVAKKAPAKTPAKKAPAKQPAPKPQTQARSEEVYNADGEVIGYHVPQPDGTYAFEPAQAPQPPAEEAEVEVEVESQEAEAPTPPANGGALPSFLQRK